MQKILIYINHDILNLQVKNKSITSYYICNKN